MEKIELTGFVKQKLRDLLDVLIEEDYFSYIENAEDYVDKIVDFINTIPKQKRYLTKRKQYGQWYCRYKANRHTTWFITFDTNEVIWIIRNIINNHTPDYPAFIKDMN